MPSGHGFLVIAGLRFDTGWNNTGQGPRWSETDAVRPANTRSATPRAVAGALVRRPRPVGSALTTLRSAQRDEFEEEQRDHQADPTIIRMSPIVEISMPETSR